MNLLPRLLALAALTFAASAEDALPKTLMTQRGRLLAQEDFAIAPVPFTGVPVGFASGFSGWRFNNNPKAGRWEANGGVFKGVELAESHHPATASYGIRFKDAIIQCEVRLDDVPADGRPYRNVFIKTTDTKDYVCGMSVGPGGLFLTAYDTGKLNPKTRQRERGALAKALQPVKLDVWHSLVMEIKGDEALGTLDGRSVALSNALIGTEKHSVMIGAGTQGSFRNFRMWEALPNADWPKNKAALQAVAKPALHDVFRADKLAELDAAIEQAIKDGRIIGGALWVERDGAAYHKAFGHRALKPEVEPMTEDTLFDVASITKVLATASAAMACVERGLIKIDDPVSIHLPEFTGEGREKITIRHLLLHSSGLQVNLNGNKDPVSRSWEAARAQACREKPMFEPGRAFSYSSTGSMVLGFVIEKVTGRRFDEFCTGELFKPLGMQDTVFRPGAALLHRVSPTSSPQRGLVNDTVARDMGGVAAHASLFTTTFDMARFARMMLSGGELDGVRVFKPETIKLFTSVQSPPDLRSPAAKNLPVQRGLGWDIHTPYRTPPHDYTLHRGDLFPVGGYGHTGYTGQMLWIDPASRTFVIFLCNRYGGAAAEPRPAAVYQLHHRISTLAAEALKGVDFKKTASLTNSLGMKFVPLPGTGVSMCVHEARRSDYAAYAAVHPQADASWKDTKLDSLSARAEDDHPVVNVSWDDAKAFCAWLSKKEGRVYRLPTDREWSIAVGIADQEAGDATPEKRSGKIKGVYPWGSTWPPTKGAGNYADADSKAQRPNEKIIEGYADGFAITAPVMSYPSNALGIYDLGGSVWEWCEDFYNDTRKDHVLRGASWGSSAPAPLLSSFRASQASTRRWRCDGFRCVVEP